MLKTQERRLSRKIVRAVARKLRPEGFVHSKPTYVVRPCDRFAHFVHFHKFTFGPRFRLHLGIRIMNDPFDALALNGPSFEHAGRFDPDEEATLACTQQLVTLVETEALPWFAALSSTESLLHSSVSPLTSRDREALLEDLSGNKTDVRWELSKTLLGLARS